MLHVGKKVAKGSLTPNFFFVFIVCDNRNDQMKIKIIKILVPSIYGGSGFGHFNFCYTCIFILFWILVCQKDLRYLIQTCTF